MRYRCAQAVALLAFATTLLGGCGAGAGAGGAPPTASLASPSQHAADSASAPAAPTTVAEAQTARVVIDNFAFSPREITVAAGTRVTWVNHDDVPHTATSGVKPRAFDSGALDTDDTFSFVFTTPGTFDYFCAVHPHMTGKVIVK
jgi:plastocyanin